MAATSNVPTEELQAVVGDVVALARIPAPTGAEARRIDWLAQRLDDAPGRRSQDEAGNLIWQASAGDRPRLLLLAHVDTALPPDAPSDVSVSADHLRGGGVGDNAAAVAVVLRAFAEHLAEQPRSSVAVAFTVGEEGLGNLRGAIHACATVEPLAAVALEGHGLGTIFTEAVGSVRASVAVSGPGGHSWWDRDRPSAVDGLSEVLDRIRRLRSARTAVNVGRVAGGSGVSAIAAHAEALVEIRSLDPGQLADAEAALRDLTLLEPLSVRMDLLGRRPAGSLPHDHPLAQRVLVAHRRAGVAAAWGSGSTDANAALAAGIPALAIGCAVGGEMHGPAEWIETTSVLHGLAILRHLLREEEDPT